MFKQKSWLIIPILALALGLRLYKITEPLADWHSWRQADTASVAREYIKHGIDLLRPTYMDLSDIPSGKDNLKGYRMVEFPMLPALVALISPYIPQLETHIIFRLVNILFSLVSTYLLYRIIKLLDTKSAGLMAALIFAVLPYNVFYSRAVLPEIPMVTFSLLSIFLSLKMLANKKMGIIPSFFFLLSTALAFLLKPTAVFLIAPIGLIYLYSVFKKAISVKSFILFILLSALSVIPLALWRSWIANFPEGIPSTVPLFNAGDIRFKGAWWHWLFAERLGRLILGYWGLFPLGLGLLKLKLFTTSTIVSLFLYLSIFASGNIRHDYYQIILIPMIAVLVGYGFKHLLQLKTPASFCIIVITFIFIIAFSWHDIRGYYNINNWNMVKAGKAIDTLTPPDTLIIAPYGGDTAFLYQTNRRGWPVGGNIDKRIEQGADYYVTTTYDDEARELIKRYHLIEKNNEYAIIQLQ